MRERIQGGMIRLEPAAPPGGAIQGQAESPIAIQLHCEVFFCARHTICGPQTSPIGFHPAYTFW